MRTRYFVLTLVGLGLVGAIAFVMLSVLNMSVFVETEAQVVKLLELWIT